MHPIRHLHGSRLLATLQTRRAAESICSAKLSNERGICTKLHASMQNSIKFQEHPRANRLRFSPPLSLFLSAALRALIHPVSCPSVCLSVWTPQVSCTQPAGAIAARHRKHFDCARAACHNMSQWRIGHSP